MQYRDTTSILQFVLSERIKELTALHKTARLLQDDSKPIGELLAELVEYLPPAWQYPEVTRARISVNGLIATTAGFRVTPWMQAAEIQMRGREPGTIEVCYLEERPQLVEGPFLAEERELIDSLAEMLRNYLEHRSAMDEIKLAHDNLERLVNDRTLELREANAALSRQIDDYQRAQREIETYQRQLRKVAAELSLTEARERRDIASDLHDHIGQALAYIRAKIAGFSGDAVFCGFEQSLSEISRLLDQTIKYTRTLTFEISPPVLYELGLGPSLEWLGEQFAKKHHLKVTVEAEPLDGKLPDEIGVFVFKSVQEILTNGAKHAQARTIRMRMTRTENCLEVVVSDDGIGFDVNACGIDATNGGFGLFSIRERLKHLGGGITIDSEPGKGTCVTVSVPLK